MESIVRAVICGDAMEEIDRLTETIIGFAIEVHRCLGPGLGEASYERALCIELAAAGIPFLQQAGYPVVYRGEIVGQYRPDVVVADLVVVEIKSIERVAPVHTAQMLTYLRVTGRELGLILNFNHDVLKAGIRRVVLRQARGSAQQRQPMTIEGTDSREGTNPDDRAE